MKLVACGILIASSLHLGCLLATCNLAQAQISSDGTLPTNVSRTGNVFEITGGAKAGNNLFHSFQEFSVPTGNTAFFNNVPDIANIINRVTGGSISNIDGLIRANGSANFILINPSGINFGPNAQLNIGGSFLGSTANSLKFADGVEFSATNAQTPPLLTISVPIGLQFGQNPGAIRVQGQGHDLTVANPILSSVTRGSDSTGLRVQPGQTLALVGGNISLEGGTLTAEGGRVELGSVAEGLVKLNTNSGGWTLSYAEVPAFKDIEMRSQALADASGVSGGSIQVQGRNFSVRDGSLLLIQNQGNQPAGAIQVNASESVTVSGSNADGTIRSSLTNETIEAGKGGDVDISTRQLLVDTGASIVAKTFSSAPGGNVNVKATDSLQVIGTSSINPYLTSSIVAATFGAGDAGNNTVSTGRLTLSAGGTLLSATIGTGKGGNLNVNATDSVEITGVEPKLLTPSGLFATTFNAGNAGILTLNTPRLTLRDGGRVSTSSFVSGSAGSLIINASEFIEVQGTAPGSSTSPSMISSSANVPEESLQQIFSLPSMPSGASGDVTINTGELRVSDGALITARNEGAGNSGNVRVSARSIFLDSEGAITSELGGTIRAGQSVVFSPITVGATKGGDITISTQQLVIQNSASLSTGTFTNATGGNITIDASDSVQVIGFKNPNVLSFISASTRSSGNSGNVNISTGKLSILNGGRVGAGTFGSGSGGDVIVNATKFVEVIGAELSQLVGSLLGVSTLSAGNAGNLTINTPKLVVQDGGRIDSSTAATGSAGSLTINASDSVEVRGTISGTSVSSLVSSGANIESESARQRFRLPSVPSGSSGDVTINTGRLIITDGAQVTVRNQGSGNAGNTKVNARSILLDNRGRITAATQSGEGGNIILKTKTLEMRHASQISAEAEGTGNGGNITITGFSPADSVVLLENSKITANAFKGIGGNIQIDTQGLFVCAECQISASSELGLAGSVEFITPNTEISQKAIDLPAEIVKPEEVVTQGCPANREQNKNAFIITGRGGLPPRPSEPLSSEALISFEASLAENLSHSVRAKKEADTLTLPLPAQGWYVNTKGAVILTAHAPTGTPYSSGLTSSSCYGN
ncbi:MAG: filamentous hemagglutinin N-terminal domain-containing protein [Scytonema sp. RU_4_4]|nr:filamentous hemagglutinin N-terminal domain-containing protein [Scytonema sp. RU_4_4]